MMPVTGESWKKSRERASSRLQVQTMPIAQMRTRMERFAVQGQVKVKAEKYQGNRLPVGINEIRMATKIATAAHIALVDRIDLWNTGVAAVGPLVIPPPVAERGALVTRKRTEMEQALLPALQESRAAVIVIVIVTIAENGLAPPAEPRSRKTDERNGAERKIRSDPPIAGEMQTKNATGSIGRLLKLKVGAMPMKSKVRRRIHQKNWPAPAIEPRKKKNRVKVLRLTTAQRINQCKRAIQKSPTIPLIPRTIRMQRKLPSRSWMETKKTI